MAINNLTLTKIMVVYLQLIMCLSQFFIFEDNYELYKKLNNIYNILSLNYILN